MRCCGCCLLVGLWHVKSRTGTHGSFPSLSTSNTSPHHSITTTSCLIAELFLLRTPFQGRDELDQLNRIFDLCGTPPTFIHPGAGAGAGDAGDADPGGRQRAQRLFRERPRRVLQGFRSVMDDTFISLLSPFPVDPTQTAHSPDRSSPGGPEGADLLDRLLVLDPTLRFTADQALDHDYLWTEEPVEPSRCVRVCGGGCVRVRVWWSVLLMDVCHNDSLPPLNLRRGGRS